jgi:hypothetical protein
LRLDLFSGLLSHIFCTNPLRLALSIPLVFHGQSVGLFPSP